MKRSLYTFCVVLISCHGRTLSGQTTGNSFPSPIDVGDRLELMLDDYLIDSIRGLTFRLHEPLRAEKVIVREFPWEGESTGNHVTVFPDSGFYRMYYRGYTKPPGFSWEADQVVCYAESRDGIHWEKPKLGLFEWEGSFQNNIVWKGGQMSPFIDTRPGVPPDQRYKALAGNPSMLLVSPDGIHWKKLFDEPILPGRWGMLTLNRQDNLYMAYLRAKIEGFRSMAYSVSEDLIHWSEPVPMDFGDSPVEHLYYNKALPYFRAPHLYLGFPMRLVFRSGSATDRSETVFLFSRDGYHFSRRYMDAFLRPGPDEENWRPHCNMLAVGILPTEEGEMSMYYNDHMGLPSGSVRRLVLRTDGFVSLRAPYFGGELITVPLTFSGKHLWINASTSAAGSIRVEILDHSGKALKGFTINDSLEFVGDRISYLMSWSGGNDLSQWIGIPVRLRFVMHDCDLYSFRFSL